MRNFSAHKIAPTLRALQIYILCAILLQPNQQYETLFYKKITRKITYLDHCVIKSTGELLGNSDHPIRSFCKKEKLQKADLQKHCFYKGAIRM
jgi:hypothetical protein